MKVDYKVEWIFNGLGGGIQTQAFRSNSLFEATAIKAAMENDPKNIMSNFYKITTEKVEMDVTDEH